MDADKPQLSPADRPLYRAVLKPHRSLGRRGFIVLMCCTACGSALITLPFFIAGAYPIVGFLGLDVLGLYLAFRLSYATARAREEVVVTPIELIVKKVSHWGRRSEWRFNPLWVRLRREEHPEFGLLRLFLTERGNSLDVGGFLGPRERERFAADFSKALSAARHGPTFA
ncbi:MAG TPA: DUF2244 domain-containing protein [Hyphomicrobiales bacterium]|nr:DUF2244 domain-containing protein [Hyphomicrobiales bacterium]